MNPNIERHQDKFSDVFSCFDRVDSSSRCNGCLQQYCERVYPIKLQRDNSRQ
jgi:hypothetical protein